MKNKPCGIHGNHRSWKQLIEQHKNVNAHLKAKKHMKGCAILCRIDDFADAGDKVMHSSTNILTSLYVRGRHLGCACWILTQKQRIISLICRTNFSWMLTWRLRNAKELVSILEELDALVDRKLLHEMYPIATAEKHSFWYINLLNERDSMFYKNFEQRFALNVQLK